MVTNDMVTFWYQGINLIFLGLGLGLNPSSIVKYGSIYPLTTVMNVLVESANKRKIAFASFKH